mmetsp:Transcript_4335/g.8654  ORF Transcript_4335/g.8654 Transcript_4335/m.8654 type:complete len:329 (-) Transcript_4335:42-1028(-)
MDVLESEACGAPESDDTAAASKVISAASLFTVKPSELKVLGTLGRGAQADVYKAEWTRSFAASRSSIIVAVKRFHADLGPLYRDREALTLLTDHPNLVKCFDSTLEPPYLVITEFCAGGSVFDLLYNTGQEVSSHQRVKILSDVAAGLRYLHAQKPKILHRDLKSSNVLLMKFLKSPTQEPFAKIADFGLSRESEDIKDQQGEGKDWNAMTVGVGTWRWMAPEVFDSEGNGVYDTKVDVFSFAILMYEVILRRIPYGDKYPLDSQDPRIGIHVVMGLRPNLDGSDPELAPELGSLMQRGWASNAAERPDMEELDLALQAHLARESLTG